jgi:hypothetical protein
VRRSRVVPAGVLLDAAQLGDENLDGVAELAA